MNELIFFIHTFIVTFFSLGALYLGKEALISLIMLLAILSNLFVTKQITLFGLYATPADPLTIGIVISLNLLQEYFGKDITKKAISLSFLGSVVYVVLSQIHLIYISNIFDATQLHARALFGVMPRIVIASLITYFVVQHIDCRLYALLKNNYQRFFIIRNYGSALISQIMDTILFSFLGLYGVVESIVPIICISYVIKLILILIATPLLVFSKRIIMQKNYEQVSL